MRLVKMIRRSDYHRIDLVQLQQILDVGENVRHFQTLGNGARLRPVVIAKGDQLRSLDLGEHRQVCELRDRSRADQSKANGILCRSGFFGTSLRFGQSWFRDNRSLESYGNLAPRARVR